MVIPTSLELPIRTTELSDTFDAFATIVSSYLGARLCIPPPSAVL